MVFFQDPLEKPKDPSILLVPQSKDPKSQERDEIQGFVSLTHSFQYAEIESSLSTLTQLPFTMHGSSPPIKYSNFIVLDKVYICSSVFWF